MENNINNKNPFNFMKKLIFMFLLVFGVSSVMAGDFTFLQDEVIADFENIDKSTQLNFNIVGSYSGTLQNPPTLANKTGDLRLEFSEFENDVYFIIENFQTNTSLNISWLFSTQELTTQELVLDEVGTYYFQVSPTFSNEGGSILFETTNSKILNMFVQTINVDDTGSIFTPLINGVVDLILINVSIWQIAFYLFIASIVVGVIYSIVILAYRFYQWANKTDIWTKKKNRSNFRR